MQQLSKPCAYCGKVFYKKPSHSMKTWTEQVKYCSRRCYDANRPPRKTSLREPSFSPDVIRELYHTARLSIKQIGKRLGTTASTIHRIMIRYDIPRRSLTEASPRQDWREYATESTINRQRERQRLSQTGKRHNITDVTRARIIAAVSVRNKEPRTDEWRDKQRKAHAGERCWRWRGGAVNYRGPNWQMQRRKARRRDDYTCQACGISESDIGQELDVHHIIPFRSFTDHKEANRLDNLVCYCKSCHIKIEIAEHG